MKTKVRNFETVEEFIKDKKGFGVGNSLGGTRVLTSSFFDETIKGENALIVLAKTKGVSSFIQEHQKLTRRYYDVKVYAESTPYFAVLVIQHTTSNDSPNSWNGLHKQENVYVN